MGHCTDYRRLLPQVPTTYRGGALGSLSPGLSPEKHGLCYDFHANPEPSFTLDPGEVNA
jgi:hypothetical protein